jgi:hypothetical protein
MLKRRNILVRYGFADSPAETGLTTPSMGFDKMGQVVKWRAIMTAIEVETHSH